MKRFFAWVLALMMLVIAPASALTTVQPNDLFYVYDGASVLSDDTTATIVLNNDALFDGCGAQIVFVTLKDTGSAQIEDYAYTLFNSWGIGSAEKQNGLLILMSINDDDCAYILGTGLESKISAGEIGVIVNDYLGPYFTKKDYDTGAKELFKILYERVADLYGVVYPYAEYTAWDLYGDPDNQGNTQGDPQNGKKQGGTTSGEKNSTFHLILGFILFLGILYLIYIVIRGFLAVTGFVTKPVGYRYWFFRPWRLYYRRSRPQPGPGPAPGPSRPAGGTFNGSSRAANPYRNQSGFGRVFSGSSGSIFRDSESPSRSTRSSSPVFRDSDRSSRSEKNTAPIFRDSSGSSSRGGGGGSTRGAGGSFSGSSFSSRSSSSSGSWSSSSSGSRSSSFSGSRSGGFSSSRSSSSRSSFSGGSRSGGSSRGGGGGGSRGAGGRLGR